MEELSKTPTMAWPSHGPSIEARRLRNAASMQSARARETPEACAVRREQNAARMEKLRAYESEEKAVERRARNAAAMQAARARETPEQAAIRRAQNAARMVALRARETPEQRAARRSQNAARMQALRAKDTLKETAESVGYKVLIDDEIMRKAIIAVHRQPLKKRREILITDLDEQKEHVVERAELSSPSSHSQGNLLERTKFSFEVD